MSSAANQTAGHASGVVANAPRGTLQVIFGAVPAPRGGNPKPDTANIEHPPIPPPSAPLYSPFHRPCHNHAGPMFSGKSTELARRIRRHKVANKQCIVVKYAGDTRYEDEPGRADAGTADAANLRGCVITHDRQALVAYPARALKDVDNVVHAFDVVGIDEGQFFGDLAECCERWASMGKTVIVAALDATFQRKPFNDVLSLVPIAEDVTKLNAVCNACGCDAAFTKRVGSNDETTVELIGGEGMYAATCRACHDLPASSFKSYKRGTSTAVVASTPKAAAASASTRTPQRPPSSASSAERGRKAPAEGTPVAGLVKTKGAATDVDTAQKERGSAEATPGSAAAVSKIGDKMRSLSVMDSPATPALQFGGFGSFGSKGSVATPGTASRKKAAGLGAAAMAAAAGVAGGPRAKGAGGPGRSPYNDLAGRGMGAVARSPLASLR